MTCMYIYIESIRLYMWCDKSVQLCIGRTYSERISSNMRRFSFSLNLDESTSNNNKKVGLKSNYCHQTPSLFASVYAL